jgi:hypothetical protein
MLFLDCFCVSGYASCTADAVDFCVSATDRISRLFLAGPIGVGPGISGICGYASLFHVFLDVGQL